MIEHGGLLRAFSFTRPIRGPETNVWLNKTNTAPLSSSPIVPRVKLVKVNAIDPRERPNDSKSVQPI